MAIKPVICGGIEVHVPECDPCDEFGPRVDALEECCDNAQATLADHEQRITTNEADISSIKQSFANYYTKAETYTKTEVNDLISDLEGVQIVKVNQLPATGESNKIYLVPKGGTSTAHDEYIWFNNDWELIGDTEVDMSDYYNKGEVDSLLNAKQNKLTAGTNVQISGNTISATDTKYTAGTGLSLSSTQFSIDATYLINQIHPVGDTVIRTDNIDPSTLYTGTTWQKISEGRMLIGANSAYALGSTGGSADAVVVTHTHTQNPHTHTQNAHTHTQDAHTHTQDAHNHKATSANDARYLTFKGQDSINQGYIASATGTTYKYPRVAAENNFGSQTTTASTTATNQNTTATNKNATATNQNTTATNQNAGVDGRGKNMPPYLAVNIWVRTA